MGTPIGGGEIDAEEPVERDMAVVAPATGSGEIPSTAPGHDRAVDRPSRPRVGLLVTVLVVAAASVAAVVTWPTPPSGARNAGEPSRLLSDVPTVPTVERWSLSLGALGDVALADDRVVVIDQPVRADAPLTVTALHVRSKRQLWTREVPFGSSVHLVHDDGRVTSPEGPTTRRRGPLVALAVDDGRRLWERPPGVVVPHDTTGRALVVTEPTGTTGAAATAACELLDTRSGDPAWQVAVDAGGCAWLDDEHAVVRLGDTWEVRDLGGEVTTSLRSSAVPVRLDDLVVTATERRVAAHDLDGTRRWRATTDTSDPWIRAVPGTGIVLGGYDAGAGRSAAIALGPGGRRLDLDAEALGDSQFLDVDGDEFAVRLSSGRSDARVVVRPLAMPDRIRARHRARMAGTPATRLTRHGLLSLEEDVGPVLVLRAWPDLEPVWELDLRRDAVDDDGVPTTLLSSSAGVLVVPFRSGEGRVVHAWS